MNKTTATATFAIGLLASIASAQTPLTHNGRGIQDITPTGCDFMWAAQPMWLTMPGDAVPGAQLRIAVERIPHLAPYAPPGSYSLGILSIAGSPAYVTSQPFTLHDGEWGGRCGIHVAAQSWQYAFLPNDSQDPYGILMDLGQIPDDPVVVGLTLWMQFIYVTDPLWHMSPAVVAGEFGAAVSTSQVVQITVL